MIQSISHPRLGMVMIHRRDDVRRVSARWKQGCVHISVPDHLDSARIAGMLDDMSQRLLAVKPAQPDFSVGSSLELDGIAIEFRRSPRNDRSIAARPALPLTYVEYGGLVDPLSVDGAVAVSGMVRKVASHFAGQLLLPRARMLAAQVGMAPAAWKIGRGARVLGVCNARREITLSSNVVFLPLELRDYIVWHELAHLIEMNHSRRFHELCNAYCGGQEQELIARLNRFRWPIIR